uniref:Uncharacterized protein n=1 Tax=Avena sativa TaxID=4498 RepID=A0ACD5XCV8_AVESA
MRVLDLEYCPVLHSACMGNLLQLRYLGLNHGGFKDLPVEIGKLKLLQTLDIKGTSIKNLPSSVVQLRRLMCLHVGMHMNLPYGICNLTSLEVLCGVTVGKISSWNSNCHLAKELGHLTKLRVLRFQWGQLDESLCEALVESLNNLHNLEILDSSVALNCRPHVDLMSGGWVPPLKLRSLCFDVAHCSFLTLPAWINPSSLHAISRLIISLEKVRPEDVQIVGMLPALRYLHIWGGRGGTKVLGVDVVEMFVVSPDSFQCATDCYFNRFTVAPSMFPRGAAPKLKRLQFTFSARWIARGDFDLGMGHLPSLEYVSASVYKDGATDTEVKEAKAALVAAANAHPNRPILHMYKPEAWKKIYKALHL